MAFAIFYEFADASALAGTLNAGALPNAIKNEARRYWNGGLKDWSSAPVGQSPFDPPGACTQCRTIVITYGTLAGFRQLCYDAANALGTEAARYLIALADDMAGVSGAVEPWP